MLKTVKAAKWQTDMFERPSGKISNKLIEITEVLFDTNVEILDRIDKTGISREEIYQILITSMNKIGTIDNKEAQ